MIGMCLKKNNFEEQFPVCMYTYAGIFGIFWKKLEEILVGFIVVWFRYFFSRVKCLMS